MATSENPDFPRFVPLGDQALLAYFPSETVAVRFGEAVRHANPPWLVDLVPAYASVGVFYDADRITFPEVVAAIQSLDGTALPAHAAPLRVHVIPVCYEFQLDLQRVSEATRLPPDDVIRLHLASEYTVYAIGFVAGFPYLGYLPDALCGVSRLPSPRMRVEPGSVGLTGRQTGIYPVPRPGGWNLLGRTPLQLVDVKDGYFPLKVGDRVQFTRIDETEFHQRFGERLGD